MGMTRSTELIRNESGQSVVEYGLLLTVVTLILMTAMQWLNDVGFAERLSAPLTEKYALIYKYGDAKLKGLDEGERDHPALPRQKNRFFINPSSN